MLDATTVDILDKWQTLISGGLAIIAAFIAGSFVLMQIRQVAKLERDRAERAHMAARSMLPLDLGVLCAYANTMFVRLRKLHDDFAHTDTPSVRSLGDVNLPSGTMENIRRMIEAATSDHIARDLADLVSKLQILSSRARSIDHDIIKGNLAVRSNVQTYMLDAAVAFLQAERLFRYGRREAERADPPISWQRIRQFLAEHRVVFEEFEHLHRLVDAGHNGGLDPLHSARPSSIGGRGKGGAV